MELTIPGRFRSATKSLIALSADQLELMVSKLLAASPTLSTSVLGRPVAEATGLPASDAVDLAAFLLSLHVQRQRIGMTRPDAAPIPGFVDLVCSAIEATGQGAPEGGWGALKAALARFFDPRSSIATSAKATDVLYEHERLFQYVRVITDLRPVFGDAPKGGVQAAVLVHSLRVEYFDTAEHAVRSFQVALDRNDLAFLRRVVDRALEKEEIMARTLEAAAIPRLDISNDEEDL